MDRNAKIFVAGHRGLVGSALLHRLHAQGYTMVHSAAREQLDLTDDKAVLQYFARLQPDYVIVAAAKVGGIMANKTQPVDFIMNNIAIARSIIRAAHIVQVKKLLFLGSSCIYPRLCPQPMKEEYLLSGPLEPTNDAYAIAKIAGIKMCEAYRDQYADNFISAMPTNLYGPEDNFHPEHSHVLPALLRRFHEAKESGASEVTCWGTGSAMREFLYVDDLADACIHLMREYNERMTINVGTGEEVSIRELTKIVASVVRYKGMIKWDTDKPDGTPRKLLDVSRIRATGWDYSVGLSEGIQKTYDWYTQAQNKRM